MGKYEKINDKRMRQLQHALNTWAKPKSITLDEQKDKKTRTRNKKIKR